MPTDHLHEWPSNNGLPATSWIIQGQFSKSAGKPWLETALPLYYVLNTWHPAGIPIQPLQHKSVHSQPFSSQQPENRAPLFGIKNMLQWTLLPKASRCGRRSMTIFKIKSRLEFCQNKQQHGREINMCMINHAESSLLIFHNMGLLQYHAKYTHKAIQPKYQSSCRAKLDLAITQNHHYMWHGTWVAGLHY